MTDSLWIGVHAFASHVLMSFLVDVTLLPRLVKLSTSFRELRFNVEMSPLWLKHVYSVLSALTWRPMPPAAHSRLYTRDSAWVGEFLLKCYVIGIVYARYSLRGVSSAFFLYRSSVIYHWHYVNSIWSRQIVSNICEILQNFDLLLYLIISTRLLLSFVWEKFFVCFIFSQFFS